MATYSEIFEFTVLIGEPIEVAADLTNKILYYTTRIPNLYQLDLDSLTNTQLTAPTGLPDPSAEHRLAFFKGSLYVYFSHGTDRDLDGVYRWNGGSSWTRVYGKQGTTVDLISKSPRLYQTSNYLVVVDTGDNDTDGWGSAYSSDGVNWSEATIEGATTNYISVPVQLVSSQEQWRWPGTEKPHNTTELIIEACLNDVDGWLGGSSYAPTHLYKFTAGNWAKVVDSFSSMDPAYDGVLRFKLDGPDGFYWREYTPVFELLVYHSQDLSSWTEAPESNATRPIAHINMPYTVGSRTGSGGTPTYLKQWNSGTLAWDILDEISNTYGPIWMAIRTFDHSVYLVADTTGTTRLLARSDPLAGTAPEPPGAEFWQGTNGPGASAKSTLPFTAMNNPACMAVRDDGSVFVGAAAAGSGGELVVSGGSGDDYAAWTDITGSLADPVNGLVSL